MVEIDYDLWCQFCFDEVFFYFSNMLCVIVWCFIVVQNDMVVVVVVGIYNC